MEDDYQSELNQVGWGLCVVAILVVGARSYCRGCVSRNFGYDDGFMVLALSAGIVMTALVAVGTYNGYGLHLATITNPHDQEKALMYTYLAPSISIVASTLGKIFTVLLLIRILGASATRVQVWSLYSITMVMLGLNIFAVGVLLGGCTPMQKSWKPTLPGSCLHPNVLDYGDRIQSIWNAIMDLATVVFPVYMVWSLNMKTSTKWGLTSVMCGGVFAAAATLVKVYYMRDLTKLADVTYAWAPISTWYMADVFVLLIAGSLPTLKPILKLLQKYLVVSMLSLSSRLKHPRGSSNTAYHRNGVDLQPETVGSKTRRGKGTPGPGDVTIALDEIDDMQISNREAVMKYSKLLSVSSTTIGELSASRDFLGPGKAAS